MRRVATQWGGLRQQKAARERSAQAAQQAGASRQLRLQLCVHNAAQARQQRAQAG